MRGLLYIFSQCSEMWVRQTDRQTDKRGQQYAKIARTKKWPWVDHRRPNSLLSYKGFACSLFQQTQKISFSQHRAACLDRAMLLADWEDRTENELLSTFAPSVDAGIGTDLFNDRTKHTQTHFSGLSSAALDKEQNYLNTAKCATVIHFTNHHMTILPEILYSSDSLVLPASQ